jgi:hypothetical protein
MPGAPSFPGANMKRGLPLIVACSSPVLSSQRKQFQSQSLSDDGFRDGTCICRLWGSPGQDGIDLAATYRVEVRLPFFPPILAAWLLGCGAGDAQVRHLNSRAGAGAWRPTNAKAAGIRDLRPGSTASSDALVAMRARLRSRKPQGQRLCSRAARALPSGATSRARDPQREVPESDRWRRRGAVTKPVLGDRRSQSIRHGAERVTVRSREADAPCSFALSKTATAPFRIRMPCVVRALVPCAMASTRQRGSRGYLIYWRSCLGRNAASRARGRDRTIGLRQAPRGFYRDL